MTKVLVNGAKGKMGTMAVASIKADPDLTLVGETDKGDNLVEAIKQSGATVVVDLTTAGSGCDNIVTILKAGAHPVVGTSGFNSDQVAKLSALCADAKIGGVIAPNFSIGAVLMMCFAKEAAKYMSSVEIVETHHAQKHDAPSGTAVRTAEMIREAQGDRKTPLNRGVEMVQGSLGGVVADVPVHSLRLPGYLAHQRVIFGAPGQSLIIEHGSTGRESFMDGICAAAKKIVGTKELFYGLETLLFPKL
jgi:4-hydroxy-tetrahydrodipicolinate reductase